MINDTLAVLSLLVSNAFAGESSTYLSLTSPAFSNRQNIPAIYTCQGKNISVPLNWMNVPSQTETLALIMEDPDAPSGTWYHWILYNIPPQVTSLQQNVSKLIRGEEVGNNSWGHARYEGPCPPSGSHRYIFNLYALDTYLDLPRGTSAPDLLKAMNSHVIQSAKLIGMYQKTP